MSDAAPVQDRRRSPFCYQTHEALDAIRAKFVGAKRSTAISVYVVLTETANRNGGSVARDGFRAARAELAEAAGLGVDAFDGYVKDLVEIGLVLVEKQRIGKVNLPNLWILTDGLGSPPSRLESATLADPDRPLARDPLPEEEKNLEETDGDGPGTDLVVPDETALALRAISGKVDRIPVTPDEALLAVRVLQLWNAATDQTLRSRDWLAKIVMRIREYPELDAGTHDSVIRAALSHPWWTGAPTPSVVYGSGAQFERSVVAWRTGNAGGRRDGDGRVRPRELFEEAARLRQEGR